MKKNDPIFGDLEYNYSWSKDTTILFSEEKLRLH